MGIDCGRWNAAAAPVQPAEQPAAVAFRSAGYVPKAVAKRAPNYFQSEKDSAVLYTVREVSPHSLRFHPPGNSSAAPFSLQQNPICTLQRTLLAAVPAWRSMESMLYMAISHGTPVRAQGLAQVSAPLTRHGIGAHD